MLQRIVEAGHESLLQFQGALKKKAWKARENKQPARIAGPVHLLGRHYFHSPTKDDLQEGINNGEAK